MKFRHLLEEFGFQTILGRSDVQEILGLKPTRSTALLKEMADKGFIEPTTGLEKGKYRFRQFHAAPLAYGSLTKAQLDAEIEKRMADIRAGKLRSADDEEAEMTRDYGI